jgi:hypothetical protein
MKLYRLARLLNFSFKSNIYYLNKIAGLKPSKLGDTRKSFKE